MMIIPMLINCSGSRLRGRHGHVAYSLISMKRLTMGGSDCRLPSTLALATVRTEECNVSVGVEKGLQGQGLCLPVDLYRR
jgi:hypothetical protein